VLFGKFDLSLGLDLVLFVGSFVHGLGKGFWAHVYTINWYIWGYFGSHTKNKQILHTT